MLQKIKKMMVCGTVISLFFVSLVFAQQDVVYDTFEYTDAPENHGWGIFYGQDITMQTVYDSNLGSRVMEVQTSGSSDWHGVSYPGSWSPISCTEPYATVKFKDASAIVPKFGVSVRTDSDLDVYIMHRIENGTDAISDGNWIDIYLGSSYEDGQWHSYSFDIESELHQFLPNESIVQLNYVILYGDARWDDVHITDGQGGGTPPTAPSSLSSSVISSSQINLSWTDNSSDEDGFKIERSVQGGAFSQIDVVSSNATTYNNTGLSASTQYAYKVRAYNSNANSDYSNTVTATTQAAADNTAPTPNPLTWATPPMAISSTSIYMVATTATDENDVEYFFDCTSGGGHDSGWQDNPAYVDSNLTPETQYSYRAYARDKSTNQNETGYAATMSATTPAAGGSSPWSVSGSTIYLEEGNVAIGTTSVPTGYHFAVDGKMIAEEIEVKMSDNWADFVFEQDYMLQPLDDIETFIKEHKHLPEIPSADEVQEKGVNLGEMQVKLLKKVEELTLYMIELKKENKAMKEELRAIKNEK